MQPKSTVLQVTGKSNLKFPVISNNKARCKSVHFVIRHTRRPLSLFADLYRIYLVSTVYLVYYYVNKEH